MPKKASGAHHSLVTSRKLVQTFARFHGEEISELELPETAILSPVYPLFKKLARELGAKPVRGWRWKFPPFCEFPLRGREKGVLCACPLGAPNVAIALEELKAFGVNTLYFFGFAGGIGAKIPTGSLVLPPYAHVGEGTSRYYGNTPMSFADTGLLMEVKEGLEGGPTGDPVVCPVWTTDALYRESWEVLEKYSRMGVCGVDMETSAVFSVSQALSIRAVALLWVSDDLSSQGWTPHFYEDALREGIHRSVEAFVAFLRGYPEG